MKAIFKIVGLFAALLCSGSAHAVTLLSENWEGTLAEVQARWAGTNVPPGVTTDPNAFVSLSTARPFAGSQSLRMHFYGTQYDTPPHSGGNVTRSFTAPTSELWLTWTEYWEPGFITAGGTTVCNPPTQICGAGTKNWYIRGTGGNQVPTYFWGGRELSVGCQGCYDVQSDPANPQSHYGSYNMYQNQGVNFSMPDAHHVCYEYHIKLNTPGVADGQIELYVQDLTAGTPNRRVTNYTGRQMRAPVSDGPNTPFPYNAQYTDLQAYRQDGYGDMYKDNVTVTTTRQGCPGSAPPPPPPSDTQAPATPAGLSAQAASSSQINLTWNASSDNVGVAGYRIFRGGAQIATTAGTSYSNTGLTASTAYSYTVAAYDAAGNVSAQSSAASATTPASAPPPASAPGLVGNLAASQVGSNGVTLSFTEVDDGTGQPAKYDIRFQSPVMNWGSASSVAQGTCATPLTGTQIGATKTCTVLGLSPSTDYQFQLVSFRGTMNVDAVFGPVSNVANTRTASAPPPPVAGAQIFADDFESGNLSLWQDGVNPLIHNVINDPTGGGHGKVLEMKFLLSRGGDGGWLTRFFMPGYNEAYVDFDVYFPNDWTSFTKLMAFYGARTDNQWSAMGQAGKCPTGSDFFTAMTVIDRYNGDPEPFRFYTYYPAMARESDGVTCWGRYGPSATSMVRPTLGAWNRLRLYVKLNTLGQSDGLERLYLNGNMFSEWTGLSFGDTNVLKLNSIQITGSAATPKDQILYFDNIKVVQGSTGGAPPADVVPPAKPRNMRVQ